MPPSLQTPWAPTFPDGFETVTASWRASYHRSLVWTRTCSPPSLSAGNSKIVILSLYWCNRGVEPALLSTVDQVKPRMIAATKAGKFTVTSRDCETPIACFRLSILGWTAGPFWEISWICATWCHWCLPLGGITLIGKSCWGHWVCSSTSIFQYHMRSILTIFSHLIHIQVHTWPEYGYAAVDVFTCGVEANSTT